MVYRKFNESNEIVMEMPIENGLSEGFKGYHNNYLNYVRTFLNNGRTNTFESISHTFHYPSAKDVNIACPRAVYDENEKSR